MAEIKRQTAYKIPISHIVNSEYIVLAGWDPNFIKVNNKRVSRINVFGSVISKSEETESQIIIDDGSGQIMVRSFENNSVFQNINLGQIVSIIGRPREYGSSKYILIEIINELKPEWIQFRKKELDLFNKLGLGEKEITKKVLEEVKKEVIEEEVISEEKENIEETNEEKPKSKTQQILKLIKTMDAGDGVEIEKILNQVKGSEETVSLMIKKGDIFENKSGRVKLL